MSLSSQDVLKAFERIRVFQRGSQRAVHKPLLILLALARIAQGLPRTMHFAEVEGTLRQLLTEFGPSSAPKTPHNPFWHLQTDGLWRLDGPSSLLNRAPAATPNLGELREPSVTAGFAPEVDAALRQDPALRAQLAHQLLDDLDLLGRAVVTRARDEKVEQLEEDRRAAGRQHLSEFRDLPVEKGVAHPVGRPGVGEWGECRSAKMSREAFHGGSDDR